MQSVTAHNFKYVARDEDGLRHEGTYQAACERDVLTWARQQGLVPVKVEPVTKRSHKRKSLPVGKRISSGRMATSCWQLTTMLEGGIVLTEAIEAMAIDLKNPRFRRVLQNINEDVKSGETLSDSVAKFPNVFSPLFRTMILAGEASGTLPEVLKRMATYYEKRDRLIRQSRQAAAYPIFVFLFVFVIVGVMAFFVIPRFKLIFETINGQLPAFTQAFLAVHEQMMSNLHLVALGLLAVVLISMLYARTSLGHWQLSRIVLRIPLVGRILIRSFYALFCRTMATLLGSGVSLLEALEIVEDMTSNDVIKSAVRRTRNAITEGSGISASMQSSRFFSNTVIKMTEVGEKSGALPEVLDKTSDYYEKRVEALINTLIRAMEPILIIIVASIVLVVLIALYLPVFTISDIQ
ncbi:General secretion pathway protein F [Anaerohalosphaera lusitana]|uniref:General secretion pathway protein F n=1 Tax=Anaerohalosphaera lusitana TaxID=1936003 RepID=A0A1U9NNQ4_9BACT|nr:type II secretion system F family protein [Anaerohalosphaera lusitana]AQT69582.1 General secretion pathway protein F [Anaerohalosphaera lusitana]